MSDTEPTTEERITKLEEEVAKLRAQRPPLLEGEITEDELRAMGPRLRYMLMRECIIRWAQLDQLTEQQLHRIRGMGEGSISMVQAWLRLKRAYIV